MSEISMNGVTVDPVTYGQSPSADASGSDYILLQAHSPLTPHQKAELAGKGVIIFEYVSANTYLCGYKATDLEWIRSLPYVLWTDVYLTRFKVSPRLRPSGRSETPQGVDIALHEDVNPRSDA